MVDVQAINQNPTNYFNSYDLTNPYAVPVVTQALYNQGKISRLDATALNMNPMMAPIIAPGIKMNSPLQADTVNFTANSEQKNPVEQKKEKSSTSKILLAGGAIVLAGLAIYNHKKIGEFLGIIKKEGPQVADDIAKNNNNTLEDLTAFNNSSQTAEAKIVGQLKPAEITDIVEGEKTIGKRKVEYKKEGYKRITETINDDNGNIVAYKRISQYDSGASAGYPISAKKLPNENWELIVNKGGIKEVSIFSPDQKQCLKWELQEENYIYSDDLLSCEKWAKQKGYNELELDSKSDVYNIAKLDEYMKYKGDKVIGTKFETKETEEFIYDATGNLTHVKFNSGKLIDAKTCMKHDYSGAFGSYFS
ncbi:MAG: hypothetical protein WCY19_08380 [Candidatus Gastranaerophilaceae bacterium]